MLTKKAETLHAAAAHCSSALTARSSGRATRGSSRKEESSGLAATFTTAQIGAPRNSLFERFNGIPKVGPCSAESIPTRQTAKRTNDPHRLITEFRVRPVAAFFSSLRKCRRVPGEPSRRTYDKRDQRADATTSVLST